MFKGKVLEKLKIHAACSITPFFSENRAVNELMWKKV